MQFTVMTFNLRGSFHPEDAPNDWPNRADLNVATIQKYAPDLIGFQEYQSGNQATYDVHLTEYDYELGPQSIREGQRRHFLAIYWKRERFELVDKGGFYLSDTPDEWSYGWDSPLVRAVNWVHLRETDSGIEFVHCNTHYNHERDNHHSRTMSSRLIVEQLAALDDALPKLVTADFNALPTSDAYHAYTEAGYVDTWRAAGHNDDPNTFHGFKGDAMANEWSGARIDWILTKDGAQSFVTKTCEIIHDAEPPVYTSDHYPVQARVDLS